MKAPFDEGIVMMMVIIMIKNMMIIHHEPFKGAVQ